MAPEETRYLSIAIGVVIAVPLVLAGYSYYYLAITVAQKSAVNAAVENVRIQDIKPSHQKNTPK